MRETAHFKNSNGPALGCTTHCCAPTEADAFGPAAQATLQCAPVVHTDPGVVEMSAMSNVRPNGCGTAPIRTSSGKPRELDGRAAAIAPAVVVQWPGAQ